PDNESWRTHRGASDIRRTGNIQHDIRRRSINPALPPYMAIIRRNSGGISLNRLSVIGRSVGSVPDEVKSCCARSANRKISTNCPQGDFSFYFVAFSTKERARLFFSLL